MFCISGLYKVLHVVLWIVVPGHPRFQYKPGRNSIAVAHGNPAPLDSASALISQLGVRRARCQAFIDQGDR